VHVWPVENFIIPTDAMAAAKDAAMIPALATAPSTVVSSALTSFR
jgi:hypothetical protein